MRFKMFVFLVKEKKERVFLTNISDPKERDLHGSQIKYLYHRETTEREACARRKTDAQKVRFTFSLFPLLLVGVYRKGVCVSLQ